VDCQTSLYKQHRDSTLEHIRQQHTDEIYESFPLATGKKRSARLSYSNMPLDQRIDGHYGCFLRAVEVADISPLL
jgi:hypothetical protein